MKQLIVNADDFGLHESINRGILTGFTTGCITSASLMPGAPAFDDAVNMINNHPDLGIGVHLTLVAGSPVLDPHLVSSLVDGEGRFPKAYPAFLSGLARGRVQLPEVRKELWAQVKKVKDQGVAITHLDSHQHMHVVPGILDVVLAIAQEFGIRAIRLPQEAITFIGGGPAGMGRLVGRGGLSLLAALARSKVKRAGLATTDYFFGMLAGGQLREELLLNILAALPAGSSEIMLHPGDDNKTLGAAYSWNYQWESELAAVTATAVKASLGQRCIQLTSFREVE